jgi:hypothetical protein
VRFAEEQAGALLALLGAFFATKFDIIRDFFQFLSLFFSQLRLPFDFTTFFGKLSGIVSIDLSFTFPRVSSETMFWVVFGLSLVFFLVCVLQARSTPDAVRSGNETVTWAMRSRSNRYFVQGMLTVLLTLYLPVTRNAIQMISCDVTTKDMLLEKSQRAASPGGTVYLCYTGYHLLCCLASIISLALITLYTPYMVYELIQRNKPRDARFTADGSLATRDERNRLYQFALSRDKCPYKFLYDGFERPWAFYKVAIMALKTAVVLPIVLLEASTVAKPVVVLLILMAFSGLSLYSNPFIKAGDDRMDNSSRIVNTVNVLVSIIVLERPRSERGFGVFLNIVNTINFAVLVFFTLTSFPFFRRLWKRLTGRLDFSEPALAWDLRRERRRKIWWATWDRIIASDPNDLKPVAERLLEQEAVVYTHGLERYRAELGPQPVAQYAARALICDQLEGVDVFWDGVPSDGHLDAFTKFGKLWVQDFPFKATFVWDSSDDVVELREEDLPQLVAQNLSAEIVRRRHIRLVLRSLSGAQVRWPTTAVKHKTKEVGQGEHRRTLHFEVTFTFQVATAHVAADSKDDAAAAAAAPGFTFLLTYSDGVGSAGGHTWTGEALTLGAPDIGISLPDYAPTNAFTHFMSLNGHICAASFPGVVERAAQYRRRLLAQRQVTRDTLSWAFYALYMDDCATAQGAREFVSRVERNESFKSAVATHGDLLDFAEARMRYYDTHPAVAFWYTFWDDLWSMNTEHAAIKDSAEWLCPWFPTCVAYTPMARADLQAKIDQRKGLARLINDKILTSLYTNLDKFTAIG